MKIALLPTWLIIRIISPFLPEKHPYKNKKITLRRWVILSDDNSLITSLLIWFIFLILFYFSIRNI